MNFDDPRFDPNTFRLFGMTMKEIAELHRLRCTYMGIDGLKRALTTNHAAEKESQKLRDELATVKAQWKREQHIVDALIWRREGF
jgi:hypothetical protein